MLAREIALLDQPGHSEDIIETNKEILTGGRWMKITPKIPLLIGEYALIEILSPRDVNLMYGPLGSIPRARENKNARERLLAAHLNDADPDHSPAATATLSRVEPFTRYIMVSADADHLVYRAAIFGEGRHPEAGTDFELQAIRYGESHLSQ